MMTAMRIFIRDKAGGRKPEAGILRHIIRMIFMDGEIIPDKGAWLKRNSESL